MPVLKFNQCDYDCGSKQNKRGSFRVYCRRVDPECKVESLIIPPSPAITPLPIKWKPKRFYKSQEYIGVKTKKEEHGEWIESTFIQRFQGKPYSRAEWDTIMEYSNERWNLLLDRIQKEAQAQNRNPVITETYAYTAPKIVSIPKKQAEPQQRIVMRGGPGTRKLQNMAACLKQNNIEYEYEGEAATSGFGVAEITINEQNVPKARECGWRVSRRQWATRTGPLKATVDVEKRAKPISVAPTETPWDAVIDIRSGTHIKRIVDTKTLKTIPINRIKGLRVAVWNSIEAEQILDRGGIPVDRDTKKPWIKVGKDVFLEKRPISVAPTATPLTA